MRLFRHTVAEYTCTKDGSHGCSVVGADFGPFHLLAVVTAAMPLYFLWLREGLPWYYLISIIAGELLLLIATGFVLGFALLPFRGRLRCKQCGADLLLNGRHFDPKGSRKPHWTDIALFVAFVVTNVGLWASLANGSFGER